MGESGPHLEVAPHLLPMCVIFGFFFKKFRKLKTWWRKRDNIEESTSLAQWEKDYDLQERNTQGLFYEYLEMGTLLTVFKFYEYLK